MCFLVQVLCKQNDLPAAEALAVAHIESRTKNQEFRIGPMTRNYSGPFGIRRCFAGADDPYQNCVLGVQALARLKKRKDTLKNALKIYNKEFNSSYWAAIRNAIERYQD